MVTVASMSEGMFPLLCCSEKTGSQAVIATVLYRLGQKNKVSNVLAHSGNVIKLLARLFTQVT